MLSKNLRNVIGTIIIACILFLAMRHFIHNQETPLAQAPSHTDKQAHTQAHTEKMSLPKKRVQRITSAQEVDQIATCDSPVIIKLYADWCSYCVHMNKPFEELAEQYDTKISFYSLNVDDQAPTQELRHKGLAKDWSGNIPAFIFLKNGSVHEVTIGGMQKADLDGAIRRAFSL